MKRYWKPHPSKKRVKAAFKFFELVSKGIEMKAKIEITEAERHSLLEILYAEYHKYTDRVMHAASHGDEFSVPGMEAIASVINRIDQAKFE